jgi:hypothetical protein
MKTCATFILLFLSIIASAQEIPNANFEDWTVLIWTPEPDGWVSDNTEVSLSVTQDTESYEGEYAMKVTAIQTGIGAYGEAYTTFDTEIVPPSLDFYVKTASEFGAVSVSISFFNNENEIYTEFWSTTESYSEWTPISLELNQIEPILTHAIVRVFAEVGDLVPGSAEISVDAMGFGSQLSTSDPLTSREVSVYPNPANEQIYIDSKESIRDLRLISAEGRLIKKWESEKGQTSLNLSEIPEGIYVLIGQTNNGTTIRKRIVVAK